MECTDKEWQHCQVEKMGCTGCHYDENKIEVGEYVRFKNGIIEKTDEDEADRLNMFSDNVVKHSKNILDLIEEGDILRYKLKGLKNEYITVVKKYYDARNNENWLLINGYKLEQVEILEILTKEQYKENCFKVVQK